jgi:hypothetical protein
VAAPAQHAPVCPRRESVWRHVRKGGRRRVNHQCHVLPPRKCCRIQLVADSRGIWMELGWLAAVLQEGVTISAKPSMRQTAILHRSTTSPSTILCMALPVRFTRATPHTTTPEAAGIHCSWSNTLLMENQKTSGMQLAGSAFPQSRTPTLESPLASSVCSTASIRLPRLLTICSNQQLGIATGRRHDPQPQVRPA